ncbi:FHA domain-containing protein [Paraflavitalea pollutisoli]|uniref:FHA domain-containing protein n=1 Tax=Paraflavitalea pollutisoli TaxID=3034143 RepID=UPI0023ECF0F3|nr:FHA domain-containing protein [Paraflavitalea sp. H1-2-19X]
MKSLINKLKKSFGLTEDEPEETQTATTTDTVPPAPANTIMPVTPIKREAITKFIIQALKPYVDERGMSLAGMRLYVLCADQEQEEAAKIALYADKPGVFQAEYLERKLANQFIQLEPNWFFEYQLVRDQLPAECIQHGTYGIKVTRAGDQVKEKFTTAMLQILVGQAEQFEYLLDPNIQLRFNIGRSRSPQLSTGKVQLNDIVFLASGEPGYDEGIGKANLHVSRNHAYIVYDPKQNKYLLYPDKGGLPDSGNKVKVHTVDDRIKMLNMYGIAHHLQDGDQIELGGEAVLRFKIGQ